MIDDLMFEEKLIEEAGLCCYKLSATYQPNRLMYKAMHQDYSSQIVALEESLLGEEKYGEIVVRRCLKLGHYGIAEHPSITLNFGNYPHSVMQQARTHRTGLCLGGDSLVRFGHPSLSYGEKQSECSIGHLADLWFNGRPHQRTESDAAYMRKQIKSRWVHVYDTKQDRLVLSHISNIYHNGKKPVLRITTENHGSIKATKDHKFFTNKGWKAIKDFDEETLLATYHLSNLVYGSSKRNSRDLVKSNEQAANRVKFVDFSVYDDGETVETFDIEVEHDEHNFIANGFVTHNSFDVQSFRYTGKAIYEDVTFYLNQGLPIPPDVVEKHIYLRPVGWYVDRQGKRYHYTEDWRNRDLNFAYKGLIHYTKGFDESMAEEHARGLLPFDYRQHFVVTMNLRTALHFLDMRHKKDAQLEIRAMSFQLHNHLTQWVPEVMQWYEKARMGKNKLSP